MAVERRGIRETAIGALYEHEVVDDLLDVQVSRALRSEALMVKG